MKTWLRIMGVVACLALVPSFADAQKPAAPKGLRGEHSLPSRYPYVVQDVLRFCKPQRPARAKSRFP